MKIISKLQGTTTIIRMSSPPNLSSPPAELLEGVVSHLDYHSTFSLSQTSKYFYQAISIPTIATFLASPDGKSLEVLEKAGVIPRGYDTCHICHKTLPTVKFSRVQRSQAARRQLLISLAVWPKPYDYDIYDATVHYCMQCGIVDGKLNSATYPVWVRYLSRSLASTRYRHLRVVCRLLPLWGADETG